MSMAALRRPQSPRTEEGDDEIGALADPPDTPSVWTEILIVLFQGPFGCDIEYAKGYRPWN